MDNVIDNIKINDKYLLRVNFIVLILNFFSYKDLNVEKSFYSKPQSSRALK